MEIKVGEYVRTIDGYIRQVIEIFEEDGIPIVVDRPVLDDDTKWRNCYQVMECIDVERITKHSPNIIDLIEEGDYVNGKQVYSIGTVIGDFPIINYKDGTFDIDSNIKTIVTHEQFKEMEYKV